MAWSYSKSLTKVLSDLDAKGIRKYNCKHVKIAKTLSVIRLCENWHMLKYNSSRHVYELDALTMVQFMARQAYTHKKGTK